MLAPIWGYNVAQVTHTQAKPHTCAIEHSLCLDYHGGKHPRRLDLTKTITLCSLANNCQLSHIALLQMGPFETLVLKCRKDLHNAGRIN